MAVTQMVVKVMVARTVASVDHHAVVTSAMDHASHALARTKVKVAKVKVVRAMKMANKKVADHHAKDASTANQKPAEATRYVSAQYSNAI